VGNEPTRSFPSPGLWPVPRVHVRFELWRVCISYRSAGAGGEALAVQTLVGEVAEENHGVVAGAVDHKVAASVLVHGGPHAPRRRQDVHRSLPRRATTQHLAPLLGRAAFQPEELSVHEHRRTQPGRAFQTNPGFQPFRTVAVCTLQACPRLTFACMMPPAPRSIGQGGGPTRISNQPQPTEE
jgi:hypothetical protein